MNALVWIDPNWWVLPSAAYFKLSTLLSLQIKEVEHISHVLYISVVDSLMYAMACTMPDISYATGIVGRYMGNLGKTYYHTVK